MNRRSTLGILLIVILTNSSCQKKDSSWRQAKFHEYDLSRTSAETYLPRSLWEKITSLIGETKSKGVLPTAFVPIKVFLVEKNRGVLTHGSTAIEFGPGGGDIDLKDFVTGRNGSFYFVVEFAPEAESKAKKVYFLSQSVPRRLAGKVYGSGCDTYFDISKLFREAEQSNGVMVNTTEGRYVSALAGTYFFAVMHEGKLWLSALTIKHSGLRDLQCVPRKPKRFPSDS